MSRFKQQQLYINGRYVNAREAYVFKTVNPANGEVLAEVQQASQADIAYAMTQWHSVKISQKFYA